MIRTLYEWWNPLSLSVFQNGHNLKIQGYKFQLANTIGMTYYFKDHSRLTMIFTGRVMILIHNRYLMELCVELLFCRHILGLNIIWCGSWANRRIKFICLELLHLSFIWSQTVGIDLLNIQVLLQQDYLKLSLWAISANHHSQ